jgi:hypothetical protein
MLECLALAIYFEAQGEPNIGQVAVGQTILNRARQPGKHGAASLPVQFLLRRAARPTTAGSRMGSGAAQRTHGGDVASGGRGRDSRSDTLSRRLCIARMG